MSSTTYRIVALEIGLHPIDQVSTVSITSSYFTRPAAASMESMMVVADMDQS